MTRKSIYERIEALDLGASHYMLGLWHKGIQFPLALQSAEKKMRTETPEQMELLGAQA